MNSNLRIKALNFSKRLPHWQRYCSTSFGMYGLVFKIDVAWIFLSEVLFISFDITRLSPLSVCLCNTWKQNCGVQNWIQNFEHRFGKTRTFPDVPRLYWHEANSLPEEMYTHSNLQISVTKKCIFFVVGVVVLGFFFVNSTFWT